MGNQYFGKNISRLDGWDKVTGRAMYAADYQCPGMLHLALVRSEIPHGLIRSVDASALAGEVLLFTADDLAENIVEDIIDDQPVLACEKVRFKGEPIAILAANERSRVKASIQEVKVKYEPLPVVDDAQAALEAGSAQVHASGNLLSHFENEKGNVEQALETCDLILCEEFFTPVQDHGYMEPEAAFAYIDDQERLVIYTSTQNVFHDQSMISRALGIPKEKVHVKAAVVGGGFGGKDGHTAQIFAALVTWKTKRPSKLVFDREESLAATYKRHSAKMRVSMGFSREGDIKVFSGEAFLDTGAYAGLGTAVLGLFSEHFAGPYQIPNVSLDVSLVYTNKPPAHAMRGFGSPQGAFATETLINRAAEQLGLDPVDIRIRNALVNGASGSLGQTMQHVVGYKEALQLVKASSLWQEQQINQDPLNGYGIAGGHLSCGLGKNIPDAAKVEVVCLEDGYEVKVGFTDIGQGSTTILAQIAAQALEVSIDKIHMVMADTDITHNCGSAAGSRTTFIAGNALLDAVRNLKAGKENTAIGEAVFPESDKQFATPGFPHAMYTFIAQAVKVRLDPVTGLVRVEEIFSATEAGQIVNPLSMAGQMQGGIVMSLGFALGENCQFVQGELLQSDLTTYLMPTALDVPEIESVNVTEYEKSGPLGVKGAAEVATVCIAPAVGAAIERISGAQLNRLPYDIDTILYHLKRRKLK